MRRAMLGMILALGALASAPLAGAEERGGGKLLWAPPPLSHPITIELGDGTTHNSLRPDQDYIIKMPHTKKVGSTILEGGRNIVIIGGYVTLPVTDDKTNKAMSRAIYIKDNTGTVHIEGLLIDGSGGGMSDGIDIASPQSVVQIENVRVEGIYGFNDQFHADVVQPFGGVKDLRIDRLTGYSAYQGLTIGHDLGPIGSAEISRVNLVAIHDQVWGPHNNGGYMVWLTADRECKLTYPIRLHEVFIQPRKGTSLGRAVWPPATSQTACASKPADDDSEVSFPGVPISGHIRKGAPPRGDFVPPGVAGLDYVSPGYRDTPSDWAE